MKKIILILLLVFSFIYVKAYENEHFKIDIPDTYKEEQSEDNIYKWTQDNKYIAVTLTDNSINYNVKKFSDNDIAKQKEYLEEKINNGLSKYNMNATVTDIKRINDNENYYLEYQIYYPSKDDTGYDIYQIGRMYTTKNYISTIIYSSDIKLEEDTSYEQIINSFTILDEPIKEKKHTLEIIIMIVLGVTFAVVSYLIEHKKRK